MKAYIGTKIVNAEPMTEREFSVQYGRPSEPDSAVAREGYHVVYEDGYNSWSPADVFERCYRLVTDEEKSLVSAL